MNEANIDEVETVLALTNDDEDNLMVSVLVEKFAKDRKEIDEKQELFYPEIMEAIKQTGFDGYVAQEFVPLDKTKLGMNSLLKAVRTCDV